ncbi:hypothetical protein ACHAXR_010621, partial [Thalassiosira sp. AJA248-18]
AVSYEFCEVLMGYLVENLGVLGEYEMNDAAVDTTGSTSTSTSPSQSASPPNLTKNSQNHSKIFSLAFSSMLKYPRNEAALLPHLQMLVKECIQRSTEGVHGADGESGTVVLGGSAGWNGVSWPGPYLNLLRALFRTLSGGKFEHSYKELLPLVPTILNNFYRYYTSTTTHSTTNYFTTSTQSQQFGQTLLELSLTIPSRLSTLLPHLPLLLRLIIPALQSRIGNLINLGLRTLEFWVDNLHPDYLLPILSQRREIYIELMKSLTEEHLQPAPYPYGLLCMRLLGKLGGVNRLWMGELIGDDGNERKKSRMIKQSGGLGMHCEWKRGSKEGGEEANGSFLLPFPLARSVEVLCCVAAAPPIVIIGDDDDSKHITSNTNADRSSPSTPSNLYQGENFTKLLSCDPRTLNLNQYSMELMEETKRSQSRSALDVLRAALASVLDIQDDGGEDGSGKMMISIFATNEKSVVQSVKDGTAGTTSNDDRDKAATALPPNPPQQRHQNFNADFKLICNGLFAASTHTYLHDEAILLLKGLATHIFYLLSTHRRYITRIDSDGCPIDSYHRHKQDDDGNGDGGFNHNNDNDGDYADEYAKQFENQNHIADHGKLQPLQSFGCFRLSGPLADMNIDPFVFNESLAEAFTDAEVRGSHVAAKAVMDHVIEVFERVQKDVGGSGAKPDDDGKEKVEDVEMKTEGGDSPSPKDVVAEAKGTATDSNTTASSVWGTILFENLLSSLSQQCYTQPWNCRSGAMLAIFQLMTKMGLNWSRQYQVEILHTAMFLIKDTPDGIAAASRESLRFFLRVSWFFFGGPPSWRMEGDDDGDESPIVYDVLCPTNSNKPPAVVPVGGEEETSKPVSVNRASLTLILSEIASTKPLVRFVVRHTLRLITRDSASIDTLLSDHVHSLKRLLFPKLLRTLPLPNQCAAVDACAFILDRAPRLIPIVDQNLLAFLSELLKMISIADGEFSDASFGSVVLIDKNGFAVNNGGEPTTTSQKNRRNVRASSLFLRKSFVLKDEAFGGRIQVPAELPLGIQLRVSTLLLFRGLIRGFADEFYDADPQSKIGNIRPHVVALLFRSLISEPPEAVSSSASALHNALVLCVPRDRTAAAEGESLSSSSKGGHRLPKELIQSCIRPILLHLRDYSKLTISLLRGLSRLLGLLSSWFNKTLGEKLLEHLSKFNEPDKIIATQLWKPGEEPLIAAAVMDLFSLLPQASQFVESLVRHTIRLESVLPKYKPCQSISPFRAPLSKYLNKHCAGAIGFFLEQHRLRNPLYSSLFQDILKRDDTPNLRKYLSNNSMMLLNVCFDRPLAIIRSEKTSATEGRPISSSLSVYGIDGCNSPSAQRKLEVARQDIEMKKKSLALKTQEEAKSQKVLQSKTVDDPKLSDYQATAQAAHEAVERAKRGLEEARSNYVRDASQAVSQSNIPDQGMDVATTQRQMTLSALELQHQGFKIVETLTSLNSQYLENQDGIVRALRWLWRSRGRYYRLLHEEEIPPRFHCESLALGRFLVSYASSNLGDTDVLFDLIRIFLQPLSSVDFSFIKQFLLNTVSSVCSVEQKSQIVQRSLIHYAIVRRFSTLLGSEGSEETKILSAQMLAIPLLKQSRDIFTDSSMKMLLKSLLKDGSYGPKLSCELLQIVDILLEHMPAEDMTDYRKDLLKYIWNILKLGDGTTKYYGYLAVSRFISVFDTPSKVILQVYRSLLRDTSERTIVRAALDILLPVLTKRLGEEEIESALEYTTKLMREEGDSIPQMVHLWQPITQHPQIYIGHKSEMIPHMVQSLSLLGLHPNSPREQRKLAVTIAELIIDWSGVSESLQVSQPSMDGLDESVIDRVLNTLVRISFVNDVKGKADQLQQHIQARILNCLKVLVSSRKNCKVESAHFKIVLSHGEGAQGKSTRDIKHNSNLSNSTRKESSESISDDNDGIKAPLLLSAEILLILVCHDPKNEFIEMNACTILSKCFANATLAENAKLAQTLEGVILHLLADGYANKEMISYIIAMLERVLRQGNINDKNFAISVIEKVDFIAPFLGSLAVAAEEIAKEHVKEASGKSSNSSMQQMSENGIHRLSATPTLGVFDEACAFGFKPPSIGKDVHVTNGGYKNQIIIETETLGVPLGSLIASMRLLGSSDSLFTFSSTRKTFMKVLRTILDSSDSLPVLLTAVSIIGKWLMSDIQQMPLTKSEREGFLWQLSFLDFQSLSETSSQALGDMICCVVLTAYGHDPSIIQESIRFDESLTSNGIAHSHKHRDRVVKEETFQKLFSFGLLSANPHVRSLTMAIFSTQLSDCTLAHEKVSSIAIESDSSRHLGDVLRQVLQLDFEGLGKRLWTTAIVDVLLASACTEGEGAHSFPAHLRLNPEQCQIPGHTIDLSSGDYDDGVYSSFTKVLAPKRNEELCGRGRCIAAIQNLVHGDLGTCQLMLELCFQAAWQCLPSNQAR